tara:strand:+ start:57 stop:182 length:126 start_codon:yes stop_codon:yes gene_type:complete
MVKYDRRTKKGRQAAADDGSQFHADAKICKGMKGFTDTVKG